MNQIRALKTLSARVAMWLVFASMSVVLLQRSPQWIRDGVPIAAATGSDNELAITTDGADGAIIAWLL